MHLEAVRDDLEILVMDVEILESLLDAEDVDKKFRESRSSSSPACELIFQQAVKERHEQGPLYSIDFLKELLTLAGGVV